MITKKAGLGPGEEAEATTIKGVDPASREAVIAFGVVLRKSLMESRLSRELPPLIQQLTKGIVQDEASLKSQKVWPPRRRTAAASRPVNSLIKQETV